jgi:hypothetical protein
MKRIDIPRKTMASICQDYRNGIRGTHLAEKYKYSPGKMYKSLREFGVIVRDTSHRLYNIDETMFECIDCEWKAYLLGMLYADGCVRRLNITLRLHEKDKSIMEKLSAIVKCNLHYSSPITYTYSTYSRNIGGQYHFNINSKKVVSDIIKLGCGPRKSLTLEFPSYDIIPQKLFHHFVRGYFDGDGCIQPYTFHIISSDAFCIGFQKWLMQEMKISSYLKKHEKVSRVMVHRRKDIEEIYKYLYKDATLYLNRKREKFHLIPSD